MPGRVTTERHGTAPTKEVADKGEPQVESLCAKQGAVGVVHVLGGEGGEVLLLVVRLDDAQAIQGLGNKGHKVTCRRARGRTAGEGKRAGVGVWQAAAAPHNASLVHTQPPAGTQQAPSSSP
jgi:hypothetical protein